MIEIKTRELWMALKPEEREDACLALMQGGDTFSRDVRPGILREMADALKFRESFLKRIKADEQARHLRRLVDSPTLRHVCDHVLRSWVASRKSEMLICFVEAQGLPHTDGILADDVTCPGKESLHKGVRAVCAKFPPREVALYMGVMLVAGGGFWDGLAEAIEIEIPDFKKTLLLST